MTRWWSASAAHVSSGFRPQRCKIKGEFEKHNRIELDSGATGTLETLADPSMRGLVFSLGF